MAEGVGSPTAWSALTPVDVDAPTPRTRASPPLPLSHAATSATTVSRPTHPRATGARRTPAPVANLLIHKVVSAVDQGLVDCSAVHNVLSVQHIRVRRIKVLQVDFIAFITVDHDEVAPVVAISLP